MSQPPDQPMDPTNPDASPQDAVPQAKNKTGLIVGLVAAGVVALAAIIVGVLVLTGGDDDRIVSGAESSDSAEPSEDTSTDPTEDTSATPTTEPTEDASETPTEGVLVGDGYTYELPQGWNDISDVILAQNPPGAIDSVSTWGEDIESGRANLITERQFAGASDPEDLRESWEGNLGAAVGVTPASGPDTEIAGEKAITATLNSVNAQEISVEQTAYLVIVDEAVYSITLSAEEGDEGAKKAFVTILNSWDWE